MHLKGEFSLFLLSNIVTVQVSVYIHNHGFQIAKQHGSFSGYIWGFVNFKPCINRYKHARNVPIRTPTAKSISKDLLKYGFRLVGPVIVYSFMQAAGMSIGHLVDCFRFDECVKLAERPWRHV